jgi:hypothetical protein
MWVILTGVKFNIIELTIFDHGNSREIYSTSIVAFVFDPALKCEG